MGPVVISFVLGSAGYSCQVVVCIKRVLKQTNKQKPKKKKQQQNSPGKLFFVVWNAIPSLRVTPQRESSFRWPPTMHTPSPQFLSDATGSDVQFPVSRNAARRSVHCHSWGSFEWECFLLTTEWKLLNIHEFRLLSVVQNDSVTLKTCTVESKKSFLRSSSRLEKHGLPGLSEITLLSGKKDPNVGPWRHWGYIWGRYTSMKVFI